MPTPAHIPSGADLAVDVAIVGAGVAGLVAALDLLDREGYRALVLSMVGSAHAAQNMKKAAMTIDLAILKILARGAGCARLLRIEVLGIARPAL